MARRATCGWCRWRSARGRAPGSGPPGRRRCGVRSCSSPSGSAMVAWRRGSAVLAAVACVLLAVGASGAVRAEALAHGPVATLARRAGGGRPRRRGARRRPRPPGAGRPAGVREPRRGRRRGRRARARPGAPGRPVLVVVTGRRRARVEPTGRSAPGSAVGRPARARGARATPYAAVVRVRAPGRPGPSAAGLAAAGRAGPGRAARLGRPPAPGAAGARAGAGARRHLGADPGGGRGLPHDRALAPHRGVRGQPDAAAGLLPACSRAGSGVRGWALRVVGLGTVVVFVALCRTEPSVLRAAAMGLVALAALGAGGRQAGMRHLAVAATVLLLLDPYLARSVGLRPVGARQRRHRLVGAAVDGAAAALAAAGGGRVGRRAARGAPGDAARWSRRSPAGSASRGC